MNNLIINIIAHGLGIVTGLATALLVTIFIVQLFGFI